MNKNILNNSDGFLTADYIFAVVLAGGFMIILFSLSMTLTVVDVVQYMTFSSARVYTASNVDESTSRENAEIKFGQLRAHPSISPLFERAKWFEFTGANFGDLRNNFTVTDPNRNLFYGVSVGLKAEMLDFKVPFFGSTNNRDDGQGFTTQIHSFLGREPSINECQIQFTDNRLRWLLESGYNNKYLRDGLQNYKRITDNGC